MRPLQETIGIVQNAQVKTIAEETCRSSRLVLRFESHKLCDPHPLGRKDGTKSVDRSQSDKKQGPLATENGGFFHVLQVFVAI